MPGCCGCVCFFHTLLKLLFVKLPICLVSSDNSHPIHQTTPNKSKQNKLLGIGREDLPNFSWGQPRYSALLLIPQMHVPYCYNKEILYQTQMVVNAGLSSSRQCLRVVVTHYVKTIDERHMEAFQIRLLCFLLCVMSASLDILDVIDM